jgi:mannan endo-1,4-beta-mannosidase
MLAVMSAAILNAEAEIIYLEAEDGVLTGVVVSAGGTGYAGSGYVTGFDQDGDKLAFSFSAEGGFYELVIGFSTPLGQKGFDLTVNGIKTTGMFPASNGSFIEQRYGIYRLENGSNAVIIGKGWGWFHIDYIRLVTASFMELIKPPAQLTDRSATASTRALYRFLVDQYGQKILAGQQDMNEIQYVVSVTGKSPAVGVFDFMDYSPSRLEFGANPRGLSESWISWAQTGGGIVSLSWHWNAPTDLINKPGNEWWSGFYTRATTFDVAAVLADSLSERYRLLLRDMDAIGVEIEKFQKADIPILWRPLHEASGAWFWWGAKGPAAFKKLWRLMYRRYTDALGLHNLVWVYTSGDPEWYPGDDVVDVVSLDVYTDPSSTMSGEWEGMLSRFNGKKPIALSESGTLPDPDRCRTYHTWWSWFSMWSGSFIHDTDKTLLKKAYEDRDMITLDELPDWRHFAAVAHPDSSEASAGLDRYPNPCNAEVKFEFHLSRRMDVRIALYSVNGRRVRQMRFNDMARGPHSVRIQTQELGSGLYVIEWTAGDITRMQKMVVLK